VLSCHDEALPPNRPRNHREAAAEHGAVPVERAGNVGVIDRH